MASAMDKQLLSILGVMQGALQGGNEATSKPILSKLSIVYDACNNNNEAVAVAALQVLQAAVKMANGKTAMQGSDAASKMRDVAARATATAKVKKLASEVLVALSADMAPAAAVATASASAAAPSAVSAGAAASHKRELRGVHLNMDGLLGKRDIEDKYIRALLMIEGVTSVTIDRKREIAIVYTHEEGEMKGKLYEVVQGVCDEVQDAAGKPRITVRSEHAAYLAEGDEEGGADENGWFGSKGASALVDKRAGLGGKERSAEERLKAKDTNAAAASGGGWLSSLTGGWW